MPGDGPAELDDGILPLWEALARAGYASVRWDKPGVGGSSGDWLDQDMADRADEVTDVVYALADHPEVNNGELGVIGASQAGWVIPLVAERISVDFFIAWSTAIDWMEQGRYLTERELDAAGASPDLDRRVLAANGREHSHYRQYLRWHDSLDEDVQPFFDKMSKERWEFVGRNKNLDARDSLHAMKGTPVLLLLGGHDVNVDTDDTERVYREILGGPCLEVQHYPNAAHTLLDHDGIGLLLVGFLQPRRVFADGLLSDVERFARGPRGC